MLTAEQLLRRQKGLGATDIAPILDLSPYKTAYDVWLEKTSDIVREIPVNENMFWGNQLEDAIAKGYEVRTGLKTETCDTVYHPLYPYLFAHPDRLIRASLDGTSCERRGLEIKNVGINQAHQWGEIDELVVPVHYCLQVAHCMFVTGYQAWDLAVLIGGNQLKVYNFQNDDKMKSIQAIIEEKATRFWRQHVEKKISPPFTPNASSKDALLRHFNTIEETEIALDNHMLEHKENYLKHVELMKTHKAQADLAKAHILKALQNAGRGRLPDGSWFARTKVRVKSYTVAEREDIRLTYKEKF